MTINKIYISNFKKFKNFKMEFNPEMNILVGNNGSGKSTILEAINIVLTGFYRGKAVRNELSQDMFNRDVVSDYLSSVEEGGHPNLPSIVIELYLSKVSEHLRGNNNSLKEDSEGLKYTIAFDEDFKEEYKEVLNQGYIKSIPIEYYTVFWETFAEKQVTFRSIPVKTSFIDSTNYRYQNGFDVYISRIMKNLMSTREEVQIMQAHRQMRESFMEEKSIKDINTRIKENTKGSLGEVSISVELGTKSAWETSLVTQLDKISFDNIGRGSQCILKTELALSEGIEQGKSNIILIEEPENHLSHSSMNRLINHISSGAGPHQSIITTHSSFVTNKLGLDNIHLLSGPDLVQKLVTLDPDGFFKKRSGYDTLRIVLSKKVILVEGDSDDLIVQRAYKDKYRKFPLEDGVDVITVGTAFKRFLNIAKALEIQVHVVTDNDGDPERLEERYKEYDQQGSIKIYYSKSINEKKSEYNNNTLEPLMVDANSVELINDIMGMNKENRDELVKYMMLNKVDCALKIFDSKNEIKYPDYISEAIIFDQ